MLIEPSAAFTASTVTTLQHRSVYSPDKSSSNKSARVALRLRLKGSVTARSCRNLHAGCRMTLFVALPNTAYEAMLLSNAAYRIIANSICN